MEWSPQGRRVRVVTSARIAHHTTASPAGTVGVTQATRISGRRTREMSENGNTAMEDEMAPLYFRETYYEDGEEIVVVTIEPDWNRSGEVRVSFERDSGYFSLPVDRVIDIARSAETVLAHHKSKDA